MCTYWIHGSRKTVIGFVLNVHILDTHAYKCVIKMVSYPVDTSAFQINWLRYDINFTHVRMAPVY